MEKISKFMQSIYGILTVVIFLVVLLWQGFVYINNANISHEKANQFDNVNKLVIELTEQVENVKTQVIVLKDLNQRVSEIREFDSLKMRKDNLATWERSRYCDLYSKLMAGGLCDAP